MKKFNYTLITILILGFLNTISGGIVVVNGLSHNHDLQKGDMDQGVLIVRNNGSLPENIVIYQKDFLFNHKGESFYEDMGTTSRSNANWLIINPISFIIQPQEEVEVVYEIRIPNSDTLRGTYWSTIMVEPAVELDTSTENLSVSIRTVLRYAVQIVANVSSENDIIRSNLDFLEVQLNTEGENPKMLIDVANTGEIMLRTEMAIEIFYQDGTSMGVFKSRRSRTYPGTSKRYIIELPHLDKGEYQSTLVADSENDEILGVEVPFIIN